MTPEDYKFVITLVLSVAGIQLVINSIFMVLLNARITSLENRLLALEKSMKDFQDEIRTKIELLIK